MGRILHALLVALFVLSAPAFAVSVPSSSPSAPADWSSAPMAMQQADANNTTEMLMLPDGEAARSAYVTPSMNLGTTLEMRNAGLQGAFDENLLRQRLDGAGEDQRGQVLFQFTYRIEDRIEALRLQDQRARRAYVSGSISERAYVQRLAKIDAKADRLRAVLDTVKSLDDSGPGSALRSREKSLRYRLAPFEGPVRDRIGAITRGERAPAQVYVAATSSGVVLGVVENGEFVREVTRLDNYAPNGTESVSLDAAERAVSDRYPMIAEAARAKSVSGSNVGISRFAFENLQKYGTVTVHFDARTDEVFKEVRRQSVSTMPVHPARNSQNGLTVTANYTRPTGPLHVNLSDATTGTELNGTVSIDGEPVATTGADGEVWLVTPHEQFTLSATRGDETVTVTIRPDVHVGSEGS